MPRIIHRLIVTSLLLALLAACATSPTGRRQLMLISPESAIVESKKAYLSTVSDLDKGEVNAVVMEVGLHLQIDGELRTLHPILRDTPQACIGVNHCVVDHSCPLGKDAGEGHS